MKPNVIRYPYVRTIKANVPLCDCERLIITVDFIEKIAAQETVIGMGKTDFGLPLHLDQFPAQCARKGIVDRSNLVIDIQSTSTERAGMSL